MNGKHLGRLKNPLFQKHLPGFRRYLCGGVLTLVILRQRRTSCYDYSHLHDNNTVKPQNRFNLFLICSVVKLRTERDAVLITTTTCRRRSDNTIVLSRNGSRRVSLSPNAANPFPYTRHGR